MRKNFPCNDLLLLPLPHFTLFTDHVALSWKKCVFYDNQKDLQLSSPWLSPLKGSNSWWYGKNPDWDPATVKKQYQMYQTYIVITDKGIFRTNRKWLQLKSIMCSTIQSTEALGPIHLCEQALSTGQLLGHWHLQAQWMLKKSNL